ncbi:hypothetical protein [Winogradskyella sp. PC D3.3]
MGVFIDFGSVITAVGTYVIDDIARASHIFIHSEFTLPVDFRAGYNYAFLTTAARVEVTL